MTEQVATPQEMTIEDAFAIVGIDSKKVSPELVLSGFQIAWNGNPEDRKNLILAKNLLMQNMVSREMKSQRYFEMTSRCEHACLSCSAYG